jgi:adenylate cyclase
MFTDMVGYTASAQANERVTLALRQEQEELIRPLLGPYQGREVKSTGDGFLVEFESALKAVECGVEIQRLLHERNRKGGVPPISLRIGIHLGDVERRGNDIYGDAVNIAARIEPLAEPGGICVSGAVQEQVRNKAREKLEKVPATSLKGLQTPVQVFRVLLPWTSAGSSPTSGNPARMAVLPFTSISPDSGDEYFADGLTEELITILAQLPSVLVIARTSVVQYKATPRTIAQIGEELGVSTIVEGSVRKAGDQLRITVQLIDVKSEGHTWAQTYDRKMDDIFAVQTDVANRIAEELKLKARSGSQRPNEDRPVVRPDSYLAYLRGRALFSSDVTADHFKAARREFEASLELDPNNARALAGLADVSRYIHYFAFDVPDPDWDRTSRSYVTRALEIDPDLAEAHCTLASILWDNFQYLESEKEFRRSLALNPSYPQAHHWYGALLMDEGRTEEALQELRIAEEVDPQSVLAAFWHILILLIMRRLDQAEARLPRFRALDKSGPAYHGALRYLHLIRGEFAEALDASGRVEDLNPQVSHVFRVWVLAAQGQKESARDWLLRQEKGPYNVSESDLAGGYALVGDLDACFHHLEEAVRRRDVSLQILRTEPAFETMRRDPRFTEILKKMNLA